MPSCHGNCNQNPVLANTNSDNMDSAAQILRQLLEELPKDNSKLVLCQVKTKLRPGETPGTGRRQGRPPPPRPVSGILLTGQLASRPQPREPRVERRPWMADRYRRSRPCKAFGLCFLWRSPEGQGRPTEERSLLDCTPDQRSHGTTSRCGSIGAAPPVLKDLGADLANNLRSSVQFCEECALDQ